MDKIIFMRITWETRETVWHELIIFSGKANVSQVPSKYTVERTDTDLL